jgi:hypothetical protein
MAVIVNCFEALKERIPVQWMSVFLAPIGKVLIPTSRETAYTALGSVCLME